MLRRWWRRLWCGHLRWTDRIPFSVAVPPHAPYVEQPWMCERCGKVIIAWHSNPPVSYIG